jgi:hypothetical protein
MEEIKFLGLSKSDWDFINSFANWASAIGSIAAAWVALHLANRIAKPRAKVQVGIRITVGIGETPPVPESILFKITNAGERNFRVTNIGWRVRVPKRVQAIQIFDPTTSSPLPVELAHGQEANWYVPLHPESNWLDRFGNDFISSESGWLAKAEAFIALRSLRAVFSTSLGDEFVARPERNFLNKLRASHPYRKC